MDSLSQRNGSPAADNAVGPYERLEKLGLKLPRTPAPVGNFELGVFDGDKLVLSGQGPLLDDGTMATGKVGAVGFCYGGGVCNALAVAYPDLSASVPFYGRQAAADDVPAIQAPLMIHYAGLDERINAGWPAYSEALKAHQKAFSIHFYPGVQHGFHNDTTPRYDEAAAKLAWKRTLAFFDQHLV